MIADCSCCTFLSSVAASISLNKAFSVSYASRSLLVDCSGSVLNIMRV